jgi:hypothetical protein
MNDIPAERLVYEIEVTAPGTRSQGWHGTLYGKDGQPINAKPGEIIKASVGDFQHIAQSTPQTPYGFIHTGMLTWMETHEANIIMGSDACLYQLYVTAEGSKSEGWRGKLLSGGSLVQPGADKRVQTPMGPFLWVENTHLWGPHCWFHDSWPWSKVQPK